jgi:hypothetical protein
VRPRKKRTVCRWRMSARRRDHSAITQCGQGDAGLARSRIVNWPTDGRQEAAIFIGCEEIVACECIEAARRSRLASALKARCELSCPTYFRAPPLSSRRHESLQIYKASRTSLIRCSALPLVPRPQRAMRAVLTRARQQALTPTWPRPA